MLPRPTLVFFIAGGLAHDSILWRFVARVGHVAFTACWCRTFHRPPLDVAVGHASFRLLIVQVLVGIGGVAS